MRIASGSSASIAVSGRVARQQRLVAAHAGVVVDVAGLGHADDGVDQQVRLRPPAPRGTSAPGARGASGCGSGRRRRAPAVLRERGRAARAGVIAQVREVVVVGAAGCPRACRRRRHGWLRSSRQATPGCSLSVVPKTACASARRSGAQTSSTCRTASITPSGSRSASDCAGCELCGELLGDVERDRHRPERAVGEAHVARTPLVVACGP